MIKEDKEYLKPRGLGSRTEDELLTELKREIYPFPVSMYQIFRDYMGGKNVAEEVARVSVSTGAQYDLDAFMYWTTLGGSTGIDKPFGLDQRYRLKIEVEPDRAFGSGCVGGDGTWIGRFDRELEWSTIGKVSRESITEILDTRTNEVIYTKG